MILATDSYYRADNSAKTVCLAFEDWTDSAPAKVYTRITTQPAAYIPGEFYKRELPCIKAILEAIDLSLVTAIVVDGFVVLDNQGTPGLGGHLYAYLDQKIPVVGLAKSNYALNTHNKRAIYRGGSRKPLYITALGVDLNAASAWIEQMSGGYRIPGLLKYLDRLTKQPDNE